MLLKKTLKNILPFFIVEHYRCRKMPVSNSEKQLQLKTSISDNMVYPDYCLKASNDVSIFQNFRQNSVYRQVLEHVDEKTGQLYLDEVKKINKDLLKNIDVIKENDIYGNPQLFDYSGIGKICPSTLRYAKVLADLLKLFGSLDNFSIAEIGVGYGGQCRIVNSANKPMEYTLIDIKPALLLAQCYLDGYVLSSKMKYLTMNELGKKSYDLIISNYAFTELKREIQDVYLEKVILNSKRGYITYNEIAPDSFKPYKKEELIKIIPKAQVIEEIPLTAPKNCIIIWGINEQ